MGVKKNNHSKETGADSNNEWKGSCSVKGLNYFEFLNYDENAIEVQLNIISAVNDKMSNNRQAEIGRWFTNIFRVSRGVLIVPIRQSHEDALCFTISVAQPIDANLC